MNRKKAIWDLIDVQMLQELQDRWANAMGIGFLTVDYRGIPVTQYSNFSPYCTYGRTIRGFAEMCEQCDAHGGLHAAITGQPYIYRCHADLIDFSVPLILDGSYVGAILGGQVRLSPEEEDSLERILPQEAHWRKIPELEETYNKAHTVSYEKVEAAVTLVRDMIMLVLQQKYSPAAVKELHEKDLELASERANRSELETTLKRKEISNMQQQAGYRYFFFVMNILSHLADLEDAKQTESVVYDFSDMMRYTSQIDRKIATLGEELNYIRALLRIQKVWQGEELSFNIKAPEHYWGTPCPFMALQAVVEEILRNAEHEENQVQNIDLSLEEDGNELLVKIQSNGKHDTLEDIEQRLYDDDGDEYALRSVDRALKRSFGKKYGITLAERKDLVGRFVISFMLPMQ